MPKPLHVAYRVYQGVLRAASYLMDFSPPQLLEGPGAIKRLPAFIKEKGFGRVLVVTDKGLRSLGLLDGFLAGLEAAGLAYAVYDGVQPNPTISNIEEALALYRAERCEALVAFGGGSPMDCAKAAGARFANPRKSVRQLRGLLKVTRKPPALFAVPTTAGTGSETTVAAVVSDPETHEKYAISDPKLLPPYAVLDPELTLGLPPRITAPTGMDALTHAVEAYVGRANTPETHARAEEAVRLVFAWLEKAYKDGSDLEARGAMLRASFCGGFAFTRAYVGYVHAIAHKLGGLYALPHGLANAVVLPHVLDWYGDAAAPALARLAEIAGVAKPGTTPAEAARAFIAEIRAMNARMGIPEGFAEIRAEDVPAIVRSALREANPTYPVPRIMDAAECEAVVRGLMRDAPGGTR
ncbi:MAG TPA: iron-containing alcohol dehydrogenase [Spirochaetales bacterium]|nr:iron-containing alcohol dehydrogenase [Spirochaetales bacterium]